MIPILIFSGTNDRAIIAFCRFAKQFNINFGIVANGQNDKIFYSDFKDKVVFTREYNVLDTNSILFFSDKLKLIYNSDAVFVLPSTEYLNRILLSNQDVFKKNFIYFGLCDQKLYEQISDKYSFGLLCKKFEIGIPMEYKSKPNIYPYIIKPKTYFNNDNKTNIKPEIILNETQELDFFNKNKKLNDFYFQEYIGGKSYYLLFYYSKNDQYSVFSQENLLQQHNGGSMILSKSSNVHENMELVDKFAKLFIENKFHGLVMVEVKFFNNKYYMIEANPRLWGPSQLILDANMSLFYDFCYENNLIDSTIKNFKYETEIYYFWSGGYFETIEKNQDIQIYDYEIQDFFYNYTALLKNEIYLKKDTINIYLKENT